MVDISLILSIQRIQTFSFRATLKHIDNGRGWFAYGNEVSTRSLRRSWQNF